MPQQIIITSPSLDPNINVGGISAVVRFIMKQNPGKEYIHFELGKSDSSGRGLAWAARTLRSWYRWFILIIRKPEALIHFNLALDLRGISRDLPLILFARLLRRRLLIHLHGGEYMSDGEVGGIVRFFIKRLLSGREPVLVLSVLEERLIEERFGATRVMVLPNSIDLSRVDCCTKVYNTSERLRLLFLGRIIKIKGMDDILEALKALSASNIDFEFILAGKGNEDEEYCRKFGEAIGDKFRFAGVVKGEEKYRLLNDSDVFLLPSYFEGLPIALLEAMAFGIVPVVTAVGSMEAVINDGVNGIIVRRGMPVDIKEKLELLNADRELLTSIGKEARSYVFNHHSPEKYIQTLNGIYDYL